MFRLNNKIALITGAATGIGAAIAVALARQGANIAITDRVVENLDETAEKARSYGSKVLCVEME